MPNVGKPFKMGENEGPARNHGKFAGVCGQDHLGQYVPRTQMTLVLLEKGLVLEGGPSKMEVIWVLGI